MFVFCFTAVTNLRKKKVQCWSFLKGQNSEEWLKEGGETSTWPRKTSWSRSVIWEFSYLQAKHNNTHFKSSIFFIIFGVLKGKPEKKNLNVGLSLVFKPILLIEEHILSQVLQHDENIFYFTITELLNWYSYWQSWSPKSLRITTTTFCSHIKKVNV